VGSVDWLWVDEGRSEIYTKDPSDKRKLPITVWYPAEAVAGAQPASYLRRLAEFDPNSPLLALAVVKTHAVVGAPVARAQTKYPVLVYSHGAGWPRFSATFVTEELASHGYVVFAIDHPGLDQTVSFSDGTSFHPDTMRRSPPDPNQDPLVSARQAVEFLNTVDFPVWIADSRFVLDQIEALDQAPGPFRGRLDLDHVGMFGWSFGGATALEMLRSDPRVKAAVNHDGRLFGGAISESIGRPFMMLHHGGDDTLAAPAAIRPTTRTVVAMNRAIDSAARERATGDWYDVTLARTNHGHFSDLPLFLSLFGDTTLLPGKRAHVIISAYTLSFFDQYLKGQPSPLLARPAPSFPEVIFRRRQ
jgi:predicted dienelactone hydrolase